MMCTGSGQLVSVTQQHPEKPLITPNGPNQSHQPFWFSSKKELMWQQEAETKTPTDIMMDISHQMFCQSILTPYVTEHVWLWLGTDHLLSTVCLLSCYFCCIFPTPFETFCLCECVQAGRVLSSVRIEPRLVNAKSSFVVIIQNESV